MSVDLTTHDRLYICGGAGKKTHLAYLEQEGTYYHPTFCLYTVCLPNTPVFASYSCKYETEDEGFPVGVREAEIWDTQFNVVTCPTCLKRAKG